MKTELKWQKFCVIAFGALLLGCSDNSETTTKSAEQDVEIISHEVEFLNDTNRVEAIGTARAKAFAVIYPKTGGEVIRVNFRAGEFVEAGQTLLQLDSREESLAVQQAEISLKDSEQLLSRYKLIDVPGAISESQIEEAQTALEAAKVDLALARNALSERTVRAPFSGHIGFTEIDAGARITPQTEIARLDDRSLIYVDFEAPEQVFGELEVGETLNMEPFALPDRVFEAKIETIDSGIDPEQRNFSVRSVIDNENDELRPGMSFRIGFDLPGQSYPAIPEASIVWGGDGAYLWEIQQGLAKRVSVTIVTREKGLVLVKAPLQEGAQIIAEGVQKVREDTPVQEVLSGRSNSSVSRKGNATQVQ